MIIYIYLDTITWQSIWTPKTISKTPNLKRLFVCSGPQSIHSNNYIMDGYIMVKDYGVKVSLLSNYLYLLSLTSWWVSNIFYVQPYLGKWSNLTNIFSKGLVQPPTNEVLNNHLVMFLSAMLDLHHGWTELTWTSERRGTEYRAEFRRLVCRGDQIPRPWNSKITMFPKEFESSIKADHLFWMVYVGGNTCFWIIHFDSPR